MCVCVPSFLQVNIDVEDVNDNPPEFESNTVRISIPENVELGTPIYAANARDRDSGKSGIVSYHLTNSGSSSTSSSSSLSSSLQSQSSSSSSLQGQNGVNNGGTSNGVGLNGALFSIDSRTGHLTLARHLDYEGTQRHSLIVTAIDSGEPPLSANLTILVEVQDVNDNPPVFERNEYSVKVLESMPVNSQVSFLIL